MGKKTQNEQYVVKEIVDRRDQKLPGGKTQTVYKVIWLGYPESQATWQNARKLTRHPELKKDIQLFNQKRKTIMKLAKDTSRSQSNKIANSLSTSFEPELSFKSPATKKTEPTTAIKLARSDVTNPVSKPPKHKNDQVVGQILSKIRENQKITNPKGSAAERKNDPIIIENTDKQITSKVNDKLSALKDTPKPPRKPAAKKNDSTVHKSLSLSNIFPEPKIKLSETVPEPKSFTPIIEEHHESKLKNSICSTEKPTIAVNDKSISEKSNENTNEKPEEDKGNGIIEKIKLQLTEELIPKETAQNKVNEQIGGPAEDQFEIKGMIMCKNEYFYLVEENGKSQILSRGEVLSARPYELIVFYEKRINIRPAEINMMVL